ncbi:MAG: hypothetical protein ACJ8AW_28305, partial [Rhodopila sp.]
QIVEASAEAARYQSGLISAYANMRVAVLKSTEAMLQQKRLSVLRGITLVFRDDVPPAVAVTGDSDRIEQDLSKAQGELREAQFEADRYAGGLIKSLAEVRVTMTRMTITALEQQKLLRRYGIPMPSLAPPAGRSDSAPRVPGQTVPDKDAL